MRNFILRIRDVGIQVVVLLGLSCAGTNAYATTLTEILQNFLNKDINMKVKEGKWDTFDVMPMRYVAVKGDAANFRAFKWINDGATGGINDMSFSGELENGNHLSFEGHAIAGDNNYGSKIKLSNSNGTYIDIDYGNFRKWYSPNGGYFANIVDPIYRLSFEPKLDLGHLNFEIGNNPENLTGVSLGYERYTREGNKNRLSWGNNANSTKKIQPAWQEISEATDAVVLKGRTELAGININGQQRAEFTSARTFLGSYISTTPTYQSIEQSPHAKRLVSTLKADRWGNNDKTYMAVNYQYAHSRRDDDETSRQYTAAGATISGTHNHVTDAMSYSDSHSLVEHFVTDLTKNLNLVTKFQQQIISKTGTSFSEAFSGSTNITEESESYVSRTGQSIGLRYNGIEKTSVYSEWDFQQSKSTQSKISTQGTTNLEYIVRTPEMIGVTGFRFVPNSKFNMTSNIRIRSKQDTFNMLYNKNNNDKGMSIGRLRLDSHEWDNRFTWSPLKWLQNSFRFQLIDNKYKVQSLDQSGFTNLNNDWIKSQGYSNVYTYDFVVQPLDELMFDIGYSYNSFKISTPASQLAIASGGIPGFVANVHSFLLTSSYTPNDKVSFFNSIQYSRANDFNANNFVGIPYGPNYETYDISLGTKISPKKDLTIEPHYTYYAYRVNPNDNVSMEYGSYSAHEFGFDCKLDF